ncbi:MAG TPA: glycosyltransferase family 39 protein [Verrucomicrobiae bacterium]|nr:glycosyltransferase family 39 protein [Verrucomicrobiae bacterium]
MNARGHFYGLIRDLIPPMSERLVSLALAARRRYVVVNALAMPVWNTLRGWSRQLVPNLVLWAALLLVLWAVFPKRLGEVWSIRDGARTKVALPSYGGRDTGVRQFEAQLLSPVETLSIRADDALERLEADGQTCFSNGGPPARPRAYRCIPLMMWLAPGKHTLRFTVRAQEGGAWFDVKEAHGFTWLKVLLLVLWGLGVFIFTRRLGHPAWAGWPVALAGLLALQYLDVTTPWLRQHDVEGHLEYIEHLATHRTLPAIQQGWETWQPPLYYIIATVWRLTFSASTFDDPFRSVQFLSAALYLAAIVLSLLSFRRLGLNAVETAAALLVLAVTPGCLFFAARINNDVLLPLLGAGILLCTAEFIRTFEQRWLRGLAAVAPVALATKGSSLAIVGGALVLVLWAESRRSGWWPAIWRTYLAALPAGLWQIFWWIRTAAETGNPLYVNAALPESLRIHVSAWHRLFSFAFSAFIQGGVYYDEPMRDSYPTALLTSVLYGEYGMSEYSFHWTALLRWGCLGLLLILAAGVLVRSRAELRPVWLTCLVLAGCQTLITVAYAVQFPFACNQNMRFLAQAFVPFAGLCGLGAGKLWQHAGRAGRTVLVALGGSFLLGAGELYWQAFL